MAAVVGSVNGEFSQYAAQFASQKRAAKDATDIVENLVDAAQGVLMAFQKRNNNQLPRKIIIYREGVSDGQFDQVRDREVQAIKDAIAFLGYDKVFMTTHSCFLMRINDLFSCLVYLLFLPCYCLQDYVKIAIVVCQKRHHARFVFEDKVSNKGGQPIYLTPCPGVVVDAYGGEPTVSTPHAPTFPLPAPSASSIFHTLTQPLIISNCNYC